MGDHNYAFFTHRVESFKGRKVTVPGAKNKASVKTFLWPHPDNWGPTPRTLAAAGFFFAPEPASVDRVECFCCKRGLGSWEKSDNPFKEHYDRAENECAWAAARCSLDRDRKGKGKTPSWKFTTDDRHPTDPARYEARLNTFHDWPFDNDRRSTCTSKALARAGFVHTPEQDNEDLATCFYCDRELGGWKATDDPLEDHRRGDHHCAFLQAYDETEGKKKKARRPTRTVSKTVSRSSLASSRNVSNTYASEADLPVKRPTAAKARHIQSEVERDATTDAGTDDTQAAEKPRRGPGRPKKAATKTVAKQPSPDEGIEAEPVAKKPKKITRGSVAPKRHDVAETDSEQAPTKAKRGKAKAKAPVTDDDEEEVEARAPRVPLRTPAPKGRRTPVKDESSSDDELLLPPVGTDMESENDRASRTRSRAPSSRASSRAPASTSRKSTKTPAPKVARATRASSRAPSVATEDDDESDSDDSSQAGSSQGASRSRTKGSSRGRKTVTARDVDSSLSSSVRRSLRTPGRTSKSKTLVASDAEADVDALLKAANARAAARLASASETEGRAMPSLGKSTRGRAAASDRDDASDPPPPPVPAKSLNVPRTKAPSKTKPAVPPKKATSKKSAAAPVTEDSGVDTDVASSSRGASANASEASDSETGMNEVTPQPIKTSSSASFSRSNTIPPPNFMGTSTSGSGSFPAPSERQTVNGWRQLAMQSKTPNSSSAIGGGLKGHGSASSSAGADAGQLPRIIMPLRKSKGRTPPPRPSPKVKIEEDDDSITIISPPRPARNAARNVLPSIDQTLADKSNRGTGARQVAPPVLRSQPVPPPKSPSPPKSNKVAGKQKSTSADGDSMDVDTAVAPPPRQPAPVSVIKAANSTTHLSSHRLEPTGAAEKGRVETITQLPPEQPQSHPSSVAPMPATIKSYDKLPILPSQSTSTSTLLNTDSLTLTSTIQSISPFLATATSSSSAVSTAVTGGLTEEQLDSTLEQFIRAETQRKYSETQAEGERLLRELREEAARNRTLIIDHLRRAPTRAQ